MSLLAKSHHQNGSHVNSYGTNDELNREFTWHAAMLIASVGNGAVACVLERRAKEMERRKSVFTYT